METSPHGSTRTTNDRFGYRGHWRSSTPATTFKQVIVGTAGKLSRARKMSFDKAK